MNLNHYFYFIIFLGQSNIRCCVVDLMCQINRYISCCLLVNCWFSAGFRTNPKNTFKWVQRVSWTWTNSYFLNFPIMTPIMNTKKSNGHTLTAGGLSFGFRCVLVREWNSSRRQNTTVCHTAVSPTHLYILKRTIFPQNQLRHSLTKFVKN